MAFRAASVAALGLAAAIAAPVTYVHAATDPVPAPRASTPVVRALAAGAPAELLQRLDQGWQDATITLLGDSTGNERTEWFYQLSTWLAARYPNYRTTYRLWDARKQAYGAPTVLGAGNGWPTLSIYNGSVPGAKAGYALQGARFGKLTAQPSDLVLLSYSHNEGSAGTYPSYLTLANRLAAKRPAPAVVPVLQNPESMPTRTLSQQVGHAERMSVIRGLARSRGWTTIDAYTPFLLEGRRGTRLILDGTHPNAAGQAVWLAAAKQVFLATSR